MHKRRRRWGFCALFGCLLLGMCHRVAKACEPYTEEEIAFSVQESFCPEERELCLSTLLSSEIYYTEDGSTPSRASKRYEAPILLKAGEEVRAVPIRAIAYYEDGSSSDVCMKTYFLGKEVDKRFQSLIVSISSDPENLYDYDTGILVPGRLRDDYALANPGLEFTDTAPANYNIRGMESEREAHVEMWEADGTQLLSENIGIRVHGGTSRGSDMKSLRLIARREYGNNRLYAQLFPEAVSDDSGTPVTEFQKLVLRNHGNDQESAYLRNELAQRLASDAGYLDTQECRAASVYLNGSYYGFEWLEESYDDVYFQTHYGTQPAQGSWQVVTPHRGGAETASEEETEIQAVDDINWVYMYRLVDLCDEVHLKELQELMDVDAFLKYCAIEIYFSNPDWPNNNCKAYRWYSNTNHYDSQYADGKWRFLLYDLDVGMARSGSSAADNPTLGEVLGALESGWDREEPLLRALLQREDMRERFAEIMEELMEGAFSYEHASEVIEEMQQEMEPELFFYMEYLAHEEAGKENPKYADWEEAYTAQVEKYQGEIEKIKEFFRLRPETMRQELLNLPDYLD